MNEQPIVAFLDEPDGHTIYLLPDTVSGVIAGDDLLDQEFLSFAPIQQKISEEEPSDTSIPEAAGPREATESGVIAGQETNRNKAGKAGRRPPPEIPSGHPVADQDAIDPFKELNGRAKKVPWKERYEVIQKQFPSVVSLDWEKVFKADPTIMGNILNDIIKVEVAPKGRPGKRPALDKKEAQEIWNRYQGEDYTLLPFSKALNKLKGKASVRQFARKVSMSPTYAYKLAMGYKQPSVEDMQLVARAYSKDPSFFYEYRVAMIVSVMAERVDYAPESSIIYYERIMDAKRDAK